MRPLTAPLPSQEEGCSSFGGEGQRGEGFQRNATESFAEISLARKEFAFQLKLAITYLAAYPSFIQSVRALRDRRSLLGESSGAEVGRPDCAFPAFSPLCKTKALPSFLPLSF